MKCSVGTTNNVSHLQQYYITHLKNPKTHISGELRESCSDRAGVCEATTRGCVTSTLAWTGGEYPAAPDESEVLVSLTGIVIDEDKILGESEVVGIVIDEVCMTPCLRVCFFLTAVKSSSLSLHRTLFLIVILASLKTFKNFKWS